MLCMQDEPRYTDEELVDFLQALDESDTTPTDWEIQFIASHLDEIAFTPRQREAVRGMIDKYGKRIGWL